MVNCAVLGLVLVEKTSESDRLPKGCNRQEAAGLKAKKFARRITIMSSKKSSVEKVWRILIVKQQRKSMEGKSNEIEKNNRHGANWL